MSKQKRNKRGAALRTLGRFLWFAFVLFGAALAVYYFLAWIVRNWG